jgi:NTE family protein
MRKKPVYGLALSGGGARGIAHLGLLSALEDQGFQPAVMSGTSMGALVAVGYGLGMSVKEMLSLIKSQMNPIRISNINKKKLGLFSLQKVENLFRTLATKDDFDILKIPVFLSVTNLNTGQNEIKSKGKLIDFAIASASIPLLFRPVIIDGTYYVDGGLTKNMAAQVLKDKCDKLIGVHVNHIGEKNDFRRMKDIAARAYHLAIFNTIRNELGYCDYIVDPPGTRQYTTLDFNKADEIFDVGYQEGLRLTARLKADEEAAVSPLASEIKKSYKKITRIIRTGR